MNNEPIQITETCYAYTFNYNENIAMAIQYNDMYEMELNFVDDNNINVSFHKISVGEQMTPCSDYIYNSEPIDKNCVNIDTMTVAFNKLPEWARKIGFDDFHQAILKLIEIND